jgi:hypothetical protein
MLFRQWTPTTKATAQYPGVQLVGDSMVFPSNGSTSGSPVIATPSTLAPTDAKTSSTFPCSSLTLHSESRIEGKQEPSSSLMHSAPPRRRASQNPRPHRRSTAEHVSPSQPRSPSPSASPPLAVTRIRKQTKRRAATAFQEQEEEEGDVSAEEYKPDGSRTQRSVKKQRFNTLTATSLRLSSTTLQPQQQSDQVLLPGDVRRAITTLTTNVGEPSQDEVGIGTVRNIWFRHWFLRLLPHSFFWNIC